MIAIQLLFVFDDDGKMKRKSFHDQLKRFSLLCIRLHCPREQVHPMSGRIEMANIRHTQTPQ